MRSHRGVLPLARIQPVIRGAFSQQNQRHRFNDGLTFSAPKPLNRHAGVPGVPDDVRTLFEARGG